MDGLDELLSGPVGPAVAIAAMTAVSYLCRISGVVLMSWVSLTPPVERALRALPGSIVAATVVPIAVKSGFPAILGVAAAALAMKLVHHEVVALIVGMAIAAATRALGF